MQSSRWRIAVTAAVLLAELAHLAWEHFHGGIVSHHILARADLPSIHNAWGALLLPALAWFATGRVDRRRARLARDTGAARLPPRSVVLGFVGALLAGGLLAGSFANGLNDLTPVVFQGLFLLGLLWPVYRAECVLGFVLGMTFTFGAVLPLGIGSIIAAVSAVMHLGIRPALVRLWAWFRRARSPAPPPPPPTR